MLSIIGIVQSYYRDGHTIVYSTGRVERIRPTTLEWMQRHKLPPGEVMMRPNGDRTPNVKYKERILLHLGAENVRMALDDMPTVIDMYRQYKVPATLVLG